MFKFEAIYLKLHKHLHYIYLLYAIPMVYLAATITPPFQNPDEPNHFLRGEQISRFDIVPIFIRDKENVSTRSDSIFTDPQIIYPDKGGFAADKGILDAAQVFSPIQFHLKDKISSRLTDSVENIKWGTGIGYKNFGNTVIYPPVVYAMPAMGIVAGKLFHLPVIKTLYLSRILNGIFSITLCFFALLLAKRSNILMFIVLLFPMTVALFASVSQDASIISCAFLLVAIIDNTEFGNKTYAKWQVYAMIILMSIIGIAKPPYVLLTFIFLFLKLDRKTKATGIIVPLLSVLTWFVIDRANFAIKFAPPELRVNAQLQVLHIIHHPFKFIGLFFEFDKQALIACLHSFIGILGWLDLPFSTNYYQIASITLFAGFIIGLSSSWKDHIQLKTGLLICAFITLIAVLTAQYVTWTALEATSLSGMQGRYLLPIFPFIALAVSNVVKYEKFDRLREALFLAILLLPIFTAVTIIEGLINRYYPG
ncbi:MAG TPA: DUF2142 domain-containing protein [Mucilaginibacter sp.]|nr:DUF2142 domain-containing protein [Mucilaginibacter sp.]